MELFDVSQTLVQVEVCPAFQNPIDQYHREWADVRFRILCELLLQAFETRDGVGTVLLPDLLKFSADGYSNVEEFLRHVVRHGCVSGLGEVVEDFVFAKSLECSAFVQMQAFMDSWSPIIEAGRSDV